MSTSISQSFLDPGSEEGQQARNRELLLRKLPLRGPERKVWFDPEKTSILFFSRGRGRGHAIPDIDIVKELNNLRNDLDILFISYATGADTFCEFGYPVIDLGLTKDNFVWDTTVLAGRLIESLKPTLVISHEEFAALVATGALGIPAVFITHWFLEPDTFEMQSLRRADDIIFIDFPGQFQEPPYLKGRVQYVGPIIQNFDYSIADHDQCRIELGISSNTTVITVLPGSWTEEMAPIYDLVLEAIQSLNIKDKKLLWLGGQDTFDLSKRSEFLDWVIVIEKDWQIDRLMIASDVVLTKANRNTVLELGYLKIPSISLTFHLNEIDDFSINKVSTNITLEATTLQPEQLSEYIKRILDEGIPLTGKRYLHASHWNSSAIRAANIIHHRLNNVLT